MAATKGFSGSIYYVEEVTYGTNVASPTYLRFSDAVSEVKVGLDTGLEGARDISSPNVVDFLSKLKRPTLSVTYRLQRVGLLEKSIDRVADVVQSYQIEVSVNTATSSEDGYLTFQGCKPKTIKVSAEMDGYVMVTIDFVAKSITYAAAQPTATSRESALGSAYNTFSGASVTRDAATWDAGVTKIDITIDQGVEAMGALGSAVVAIAPEGALTVTGTADIYAEAGGKTFHDLVANGTSSTIVFNAGSTGALKLTLSTVVFPKFELTLNTSDPVLKPSVQFMAKSVACATV